MAPWCPCGCRVARVIVRVDGDAVPAHDGPMAQQANRPPRPTLGRKYQLTFRVTPLVIETFDALDREADRTGARFLDADDILQQALVHGLVELRLMARAGAKVAYLPGLRPTSPAPQSED